MAKMVLRYGIVLFLLLAVFQLMEYFFFSYKITLSTYLGLVGFFFLLIGIAGTWYFTRPVQEASTADPDLLAQFSPRELEVLNLIAKGYANKEIAQLLDLSPNTIKTHISKLYDKLGVNNRTQAASEAKLLKLIE